MLCFAGIDLTCSPRKKSAYALLDSNLNIVRLRMYTTNEDIIEVVEHDKPALIGIDAPLTLPEGLCCLNEECPCQPLSSKKGRQCERDLSGEGISSYYTSKKSIIKDMIVRAIVLKNRLECSGFKVREVYPYASKRRLWGNNIPGKATASGRKFLKERISNIIINLHKYSGLHHDEYDAIIAAYTVYLVHTGGAELIGDPAEGQIVVPRGVEAKNLTRRA